MQPQTQTTHPAGWQADLRLRFATASGSTCTRLVERRHRGPLVVQRTFHPEGDPCHAYIVHPPGGVVGGDELQLRARIDPGAHALLTTPAATKFYRCEQPSLLTQEFSCEASSLEWLPQENIFFRGADVRTATRVHLEAESRFIGWEIGCLGLPARGEAFERGRLQLDFELWRDGTPAFIDRLRLRGDSLARAAHWGLGGSEAVGTLLATPATQGMLDTVRALLDDRSAATLVDGVLVLRALAAQAEIIRHRFIASWRALRRELMGRVAVPPRIWAT